jgi:hypothetical protein
MSDAPVRDAAPSNVGRRLRDWLLLEGAERRVRALAPDRHALVRKHFEAGRRRASIADDLNDDASLPSAFPLYREAAALLVAAAALEADPATSAEDALAAPWETLDALVRAGKVPPPPPAVAEARAALAPAPLLADDEAAPEALRARHLTVQSGVAWLRALSEPRTPGELRLARAVRVSVAALVVVVALVKIVSSLDVPTNLALHKKVTASSRHPASLAPADNGGLVNGEIEAGYGVHTGLSGAVTIDLGAVFALGRVVVHNRADAWLDDGLPLTLELSEDGSTFSPLETRAAHFTASSPWVADANNRRARFVRVRSDRYVVLTEVEVFGAK